MITQAKVSDNNAVSDDKPVDNNKAPNIATEKNGDGEELKITKEVVSLVGEGATIRTVTQESEDEDDSDVDEQEH